MSSTRLVTLAAALVAAGVSAGAQTPPSGRTLVAHDFSTSAQGWRVSGDTGTTDPEFHREGGEAGGFISNVDEAVGETWYFKAPDSVLKALSAAENGTLRFSLKQSMDGLGFIDDDIIIQGPAGRLVVPVRQSASHGLDGVQRAPRGHCRLAVELERSGHAGANAARAREPDERRDPRRIPHRTG